MAPKLFLQVVPEPKAGKNRAHIDLVADDYQAELDRLTGLGARLLRDNTTPDGRRAARPGAYWFDLNRNSAARRTASAFLG